MSEIFGKIKKYIKRATLICGLSLLVFFAAFYLVNLDIHPASKTSSQDAIVASQNQDDELKKRLGTTAVGMESYADWAKRFGLTANNNGLDADPDQDGLLNYLEYVHGTNPLKADTDGDGFSDADEIKHGYDPDAKGDIKVATFVRIDKLNVGAPMVWSKEIDEQKQLADLEQGLSHFPESGSAGQNGNMIISGHSSNYIWAKGDYNHVFKDLNNLNSGDTITIKTFQENGRVIVYQYQVNDKFVTSPDDQKIFTDSTNSTLTLSTCWPLGTNLKRLIVKAELIK